VEAPCWPSGGRSDAAATAGDRSCDPTGTAAGGKHGTEVDFFLEYDRGTELLDRLAAKLAGYQDLAAATEIATPVLFWLQTAGREATVRQALAGAARWGPVRFLVVTASPALAHSPAEAFWQPLGCTQARRRQAYYGGERWDSPRAISTCYHDAARWAIQSDLHSRAPSRR
jgi:hypothetical protein